uniref:ethanolamine kinase n=1 Tax=Proboscia inermis TaxID=420281 RepID=A0A7S0CID5_9STRA
MKQAKNPELNYRSNEDETRASSLFDLQFVEDELHHLQANIVPQESKVVFCHNDILAANVMMLPETGNVQLIDFEYGGVNFAAFDIANHFNEWAGGTDDGVPDYSMFPDEEERIGFITEYLRVLQATNVDLNGSDKAEEQPGDNEEKVEDERILKEVHALAKEVDAFLLVNHLYWGLWAVNQGKTEGCEDFDYFLYASNRFAQYRITKDDTASG